MYELQLSPLLLRETGREAGVIPASAFDTAMSIVTNVYVDGFNLYYRVVKNTPYKWLNIAELCRLLLPNHHIQTIKYFTAHVGARPDDPGVATRQEIYLRGLRTIPNLQLIFGKFMTNLRRMPVADTVPPQLISVTHATATGSQVLQLPVAKLAGPQLLMVVRTDEKGSDVNLAAHLLQDGYLKKYDCAVVVSDDSDLAEPLRMVRQELGLRVGILSSNKRPSRSLLPYATFFKRIRSHVLALSQFPPVLTDADGTFQKPPSW